MLEFHTPSAEDKPLFEKKSKFLAYEYYFSYCMLWKDSIGITICKNDTALYIHIQEDDCFLLPIAEDLLKAMDELETYCKESGTRFQLECVPSKEALELQQKGYEIEHVRNLDDYIYESQKLIKLPGKHLQSKRNHVSQFERKYTYVVQPLTKELFPECMKMVSTTWLNGKEMNKEIKDELHAIQTAFDNWDLLGLVGILICVDHHLTAFTIGEVIDEKLAIVHFEKGDVSYSGIYSVVNQLFCSMYLSDVQYINRQEDVGVEGLRKAKLSYQPVMMEEKYRVRKP
ncbi:phosphatidylglycerol lysyltransferase domain-containing protein [uncultured Sphaerochaeta sp.]|uniref:DUF2156 domain-containing protein n=1 Tax=uncultured Sphaerochaeta sp. TaxID=886478 RepID=UPI002A0A5317|nr:phosphatidylglycerol lysyltransferase domain-containing protein [uncultured Sphaerochaeta sp.]